MFGIITTFTGSATSVLFPSGRHILTGEKVKAAVNFPLLADRALAITLLVA